MVIGGLITATLLTLVVLPVLYVTWFGRKAAARHPVPMVEAPATAE